MKNSFRESFLSLAGMQIVAYLLPIALIPYLIATIGLGYVGEIAVATSICTLLSLIVEYGFTLYGARHVSIARGNDRQSEIGRTLITITQSKVSLLLALTPLYAIFWYCAVDGYASKTVYAASYLIVVAQALSTNWFFQGMERMRYLFICTATIRGSSVLLVVILVRDASAYYLVPVVQGVAGVLISVMTLKEASKIAAARYIAANVRDMREAFAGAAPLFGTSVMSSAIASGGVVVLAAFSQPHELIGVYSTYEKIMKAAQSMFSPVTQALFPISARLLSANVDDARRLLEKTLWLLFVLTSLSVAVAYVAAKFIVGEFFNGELAQHSGIVLILAPWFVAGVCNNILGTQFLVAGGHASRYLTFMTIGSAITLTTQIVLVQSMGINAIAIGMSAGETVLFILLLTYYFAFAPRHRGVS